MKVNTYRNIAVLFLISLFITFFELWLFKLTAKIEFIIGIQGVFALGLITFIFLKDYKYFFIFLFFTPFLYLNNALHYQLNYEILFVSPLIFLGIITFIISIHNYPQKGTKSGNIGRIINVIFFYYLGSALLGFLNNNIKEMIVYELYHFSLFLFYWVFYKSFNSRREYSNIFIYILIIFTLISFEYIIFGQIGSGIRFVTFQAGFLPFIITILIIKLLIQKNSKQRFLYSSIIIIMLLALFSTLTRSLWGTTLISVFISYVIYLKNFQKLSVARVIILSIIIGVFFVGYLNFSNSGSLKNTNAKQRTKVEYRTKSITNPAEDQSFLMRVELDYYAIVKFINRPIWGWGLGDYLQYRFLGDSHLKNNYLDNSWIYFLWKGGIIGFILFLVLYFKVFKTGFIILRYSQNDSIRANFIGIIGGLSGLMILALLSPILIKYQTNVLLALVFAYIEFEFNKIKNSNPHSNETD